MNYNIFSQSAFRKNESTVLEHIERLEALHPGDWAVYLSLVNGEVYGEQYGAFMVVGNPWPHVLIAVGQPSKKDEKSLRKQRAMGQNLRKTS
tara:strand:- start:1454 stop:1729 length:276 start_codon:yes stop_codon:yes gene_type:complete